MARLFTEEFVRSIDRLRIVARQVPPAGRHAEHRSRDLGAGAEFRDFRAYVPGDDLRRVDWNIYRRSGRLFLRLFDEPEDLPVYILLDISDSMFFDDPPRADAGRQIAAIMAGASLNQYDRTSLYPFGQDLLQPLASTSGRHSLPRVLGYLEGLESAGPTDMRRSLARFRSLPLRRGLVALISDFFDPGGIEPVIQALRALPHRLLLVQVVRDSDALPGLDGELRLVDCETGRWLNLTITSDTLQRYRHAYDAFCARILDFAALRQAAHVRLYADRPVLAQLGSIFVDGVFVT